MKNKFFIIFFILIFQNQTISHGIEPKSFISEVVDEAKKILVATNSKEIKEKKLSEMALRVADINGIGMYSLGSYKKTLNENQLKEYNVLFQQYFLKSFTSRLADYSDPKIEVLSSEKLNTKYTMVRSVLLATDQRPEVKIDWRVYTANIDKPLIRDLIVEGLSLARTQKEEFASILNSNNNDIKALINKLDEFSKE